MGNEVMLSCKKICKNFGPTRALIDVDFELRRGQVCGLIGENGSGKSTLTSIFAGVQPAVSGEMFREGQPYKPTSMLDAQRQGVAMVVQEAGTMPGVDVASNIFVGNLEKFSKLGFLDVKKMHAEAARILKEIGAEDIDPYQPTSSLNFEDRKILEIARAMYLQPDILIIDETTTALAQKGRTLLYKLIRKMQAEDKGVMFISHDLDELVEVCNTITVLRDGVIVGHLDGDDITVTKMRPLMVGREMTEHYYRDDYDPTCSDEVALDIQHVTTPDGYVMNFSAKLHKGEILGIGGLANSGMHEVGRLMFGVDPTASGEVLHVASGQKVDSPAKAIKLKMGYISKDRDTESINLNASIQDNITLPSLKKLQKGIFISPASEKKMARSQVGALSIKCVSEKQFCTELSGGNKQKVAFGKWIASASDIIIMDCPTRGIDIGVKAAMYDLMYEFKKEGKAIVMISEELPELIGMSDRMLIMKDGRVTHEVLRSPDVTDSQLIDYMV